MKSFTVNRQVSHRFLQVPSEWTGRIYWSRNWWSVSIVWTGLCGSEAGDGGSMSPWSMSGQFHWSGQNQIWDVFDSEAENVSLLFGVIDECWTEQTSGVVFVFFKNLCSETKAKPRFLLISGEQFCFRVLGKHLKLNVGQLVRFYSSRQAYEADQNWTELNVGSWKKEKGT